MKARTVPAPLVYERRGIHLVKLEEGNVYDLWETCPPEFEARACCHVHDRYALYSCSEGYLIEFAERTEVGTFYRALLSTHRPTPSFIGREFLDRTLPGNWCFVMAEFDQLPLSEGAS